MENKAMTEEVIGKLEKAPLQMGTIMDTIANAPENFEESKQKLEDSQNMVKAVFDKEEMMKQMAIYKAAHTPKVKEYKIGRNDKCPCGSGLKYKNCCLASGTYENYKMKS